MHGLRVEYQDRLNFVVLDFDRDEDSNLAKLLGIAKHPAYALIMSDSDEVVARIFGPQSVWALRDILDNFVMDYGVP